jgi:hypothetical protein
MKVHEKHSGSLCELDRSTIDRLETGDIACRLIKGNGREKLYKGDVVIRVNAIPRNIFHVLLIGEKYATREQIFYLKNCETSTTV